MAKRWTAMAALLAALRGNGGSARLAGIALVAVCSLTIAAVVAFLPVSVQGGGPATSTPEKCVDRKSCEEVTPHLVTPFVTPTPTDAGVTPTPTPAGKPKPFIVAGTPSCSNNSIGEGAGLAAISVPAPVQSGEYPFKANGVQHSLTLNVFVIDSDPPTQAFDWSSTLPMDAVIIQSSTLFANVYVFAPPGEIAAGANNTAATHLFILKLTFCYDKDPIEPATVDQDKDGCLDQLELQPAKEASSGGGRDPLYFWDFTDQWTPGAKDKSIVIGDILAVVGRFGASLSSTRPVALTEALIPPASATGYHASADRGPGLSGPNPWNLTPPDGSIVIGDILAVVAQFGHSCA